MTKTKWYHKPVYLLVALALVLSLGIVAVPMAGTVEASPATLHVSKWTEYAGNPIFGQGVDSGPKAYYPTVVKLSDNDYRMWYGSDSGVGYATSPDGLTWTEVSNPVTGLTNANHPLVEYIDGKFRIWYWDTGVSIYTIDALRYAESTDGINWSDDQHLTQDDTYKLITGPGTGWNSGSYGPGDVIYNPSGSDTFDDSDIWNNKYVFYYMATNGSNEYIGLAYSIDGKHWKRYGDDPVLSPCTEADDPGVGWDYRSVGYPTVMKDAHGIWHMWFCGGPNTNHGIGYAWSPDGINWTKVSNPIFHKEDGVTWRADRTYTPMVIQDGAKYKMWFSGKDASGNYAIGYATADGPYPTIQAAIDAASGGDTINVAGGTYTEYLHITTDGLTIQGAGIDQSIIDLDGLTPYWHYSGCSSSYASRAGVLISGYGSPDEIVEGVTFRGFTVKNAGLNPPITATGIHTGGGNVATLTDAGASWTPGELVGQWVHNYGDRDTDYKPARSYGQITANAATTVTAALSGGMESDWDTGDQYLITPYKEFYNSFWIHYPNYDGLRGISIGNGKNILIQNCKVTDSGYGGITTGYARCVSTHKYSEYITIDNCIITDHPTSGINIGNNVGPFTVTNNVCERIKRPAYHDTTREYAGHGIQVSGTKNYGMASGLIANNICRDNGFEGIIVTKYTDGVIVEDNIVTGHNFDEDGAGIFMYHWGHPELCTNHTVRNNKVTGNHRGIIAYYASNCVIEGNNIETDSGIWYDGPGIKLDHSNNIEVTDNHIHGVEGHAILVVWSNDNDIHDNSLNNNGRTGIYLSCSDDNEVCYNSANRNEYGIKVCFSNDNNIEGNRVQASDDYDLYEEGSTGNTWVNNKYKTKNW